MGQYIYTPDKHPETDTVDGRASHVILLGGTWNNIRNGAGNASNDTAGHQTVSINPYFGNNWLLLTRMGLLFNINSYPYALIRKAHLDLWKYDSFDYLRAEPWLGVYSFSPNSDTAIIDSDYAVANWGSTPLAPVKDWDETQVTNPLRFHFNTDGINYLMAALAGDGIVRIGLREARYDVPDVEPPGASSSGSSFWDIYQADWASSIAWPKLVLERYTMLPQIV